MSRSHQIQFSRSKFGRVMLHLFATVKAGHVRFHLAGVLRELIKKDLLCPVARSTSRT